MKYFIVDSSGLMREVSKEEYDKGFDNPYVTLAEETGETLTITKQTQETEYEELKYIHSTVGTSKS